MKTTLSVEVELTYRAPDLYGECTDPDFAMAIVEVSGTPDNWKVIRAIWKFTGDPVEKFLLDGKNNKIEISEAANKEFSKRTVDKVCTG